MIDDAETQGEGKIVGWVRWVLGAFLLGMVGGGCASGRGAVWIPEALEDEDLALGYVRESNRNSEDFSEQIVVRGPLDGGGSFYAKLLITNLAGSDGRASARVSLTLGDGRVARWSTRQERGEWRWEEGRLFAEVGEATFEVRVGEARVQVAGEEFALDVRVTSDLPALRPAGGLVGARDAAYVTTLPIPRGRLEGKLTAYQALGRGDDAAEEEADASEGEEGAEEGVPGERASDEEVIAIQGVVMVDHRAGNIPPYRLARAWYHLLEIGAEQTVAMSAFTRAGAQPGRPARGWFFAADDAGVVMYAPEVEVRGEAVARDGTTGYAVPARVRVRAATEGGVRGVLVAGALTSKKDDLSSLKKLERIVVRQLMKPWTFRFDDARFLFREEHVGGRQDVRGKGTFMYQQINE